MNRLWIVLLLLSPAFGKAVHAPLPAQVYTAKTIAIVNHTGTQKVADKAYEELQKWGRFTIVQNAESADIVIVIGMEQHSVGATANTYGNNTTVTESQVTNISSSFFLKGEPEPFFSETERVNIFRKSATQRGIDELKSELMKDLSRNGSEPAD